MRYPKKIDFVIPLFSKMTKFRREKSLADPSVICGVHDPKSADWLTQPYRLSLPVSLGRCLDGGRRYSTVSKFGSLPAGQHFCHNHLICNDTICLVATNKESLSSKNIALPRSSFHSFKLLWVHSLGLATLDHRQPPQMKAN